MNHGSCLRCDTPLRMEPWELAADRFFLLSCPECGLTIRVVVRQEHKVPLPRSVTRAKAAAARRYRHSRRAA